MKVNKPTFVTPRGVAAYPYLTRADYAYNADGIFKTKLRMSEEDAAPLMEQIKSVIAEEFGDKAKSAQVPYKRTDTGEIEFSLKSKFKPKVADSTGQMIPESATPTIFGGSTLKIAGVVFPYRAAGKIGVSLQMGGVQIVGLAEASGGNFDFGVEEGGFTHEPTAANDNEAANGEAYNF